MVTKAATYTPNSVIVTPKHPSQSISGLHNFPAPAPRQKCPSGSATRRQRPLSLSTQHNTPVLAGLNQPPWISKRASAAAWGVTTRLQTHTSCTPPLSLRSVSSPGPDTTPRGTTSYRMTPQCWPFCPPFSDFTPGVRPWCAYF
ncbi:hypothetical protein LY76DRAFT_295383 [Colletotrichum caudatum]|nr:hypothetical protein LY76DRAFT_295383 [Colletotrichum caudatum]